MKRIWDNEAVIQPGDDIFATISKEHGLKPHLSDVEVTDLEEDLSFGWCCTLVLHGTVDIDSDSGSFEVQVHDFTSLAALVEFLAGQGLYRGVPEFG